MRSCVNSRDAQKETAELTCPEVQKLNDIDTWRIEIRASEMSKQNSLCFSRLTVPSAGGPYEVGVLPCSPASPLVSSVLSLTVNNLT